MNNINKRVRTRIAPSPTGFFHLGTARTALFNYLFSKQQGGDFILRIEDTDIKRSKPEFEANIFEALEWLNLTPTETYRQSDRLDIYQTYLKQLIDSDQAYISPEPAKDDSGQIKNIIRFKNPNKIITFTDLIRGEISFDTTELGDFVIAKDLTEPLYHLVVVIDDHEMEISHIIRGEDHISNTPRQILIMEAIGASRPVYAHIPLILAPDKSKLSKRHGAIAVTEYRNQGYLAEAVLNFMAILGWSPQKTGSDQEIFNLDELINQFNLQEVSKSGAVFNLDKLNWINREHLLKLPPEEITEIINQKFSNKLTDRALTKLKDIILDRINHWGELDDMIKNEEFDYLFTEPTVTLENLKSTQYLPRVIELLKSIEAKDFTADKIKETLWPFATEMGRGEVLWPMRMALTGKLKSPDPFTIAEILGPDKTLKRLNFALSLA